MPKPADKSLRKTLRVRRVAETGVGLALASVLSLVVLWRFPGGGAVTLGATVPLWVLARRHGPAWGVLAGGAFGMLQLILASQVVHPLQAFLDYPLAYATQGLVGLRAMPPAAALLAAVVARILAHTAATPYFVGDLGLVGVLKVGVTYNAGFLIPDALLGVVLWQALVRMRPDLSGLRESPAGAAP